MAHCIRIRRKSRNVAKKLIFCSSSKKGYPFTSPTEAAILLDKIQWLFGLNLYKANSVIPDVNAYKKGVE